LAAHIVKKIAIEEEKEP